MSKRKKKYTERSTGEGYNLTDIHRLLGKVADSVNRKYEGKELVLVPVMTGALVFAADLLRKLDKPSKVWVEVVTAARKPGGEELVIRADFLDPANLYKNILLVEDIIHTGRTLNAVITALCGQDDPRRDEIKGRIAAAALLRNACDVPLLIAEENLHWGERHTFGERLVGYGMGFNGLHRNRPEIKKLLCDSESVV